MQNKCFRFNAKCYVNVKRRILESMKIGLADLHTLSGSRYPSRTPKNANKSEKKKVIKFDAESGKKLENSDISDELTEFWFGLNTIEIVLSA